jgi:hypothetical protein
LVVPTVVILKPIKVETVKTLQILGFYLIALTWLSLVLFVSNPMKVWQPLGNFLLSFFVEIQCFQAFWSSTFCTHWQLSHMKWRVDCKNGASPSAWFLWDRRIVQVSINGFLKVHDLVFRSDEYDCKSIGEKQLDPAGKSFEWRSNKSDIE